MDLYSYKVSSMYFPSDGCIMQRWALDGGRWTVDWILQVSRGLSALLTVTSAGKQLKRYRRGPGEEPGNMEYGVLVVWTGH